MSSPANANSSGHIPEEVERAVNNGVVILPLRIEDVMPGKSLDYFIGSVHWLDAMTPPLEKHLDDLVGTVQKLLPSPIGATASHGPSPAALPQAPPAYPSAVRHTPPPYASKRAEEQDRHIDFSLTTNATLLTPAIIEFLSENRIGVTVSMDGPKAMHDHLRVFADGRGSYDIIEPRVRALIQNHRTRPITARVTLTAGVSDVIRIFRHLKQDLGFHEVGFAPVTTSPNQLYAIGPSGMDHVLEQFHTLADEYLAYALRGEAHGFSNVSDTLAELCQGMNKSHPCGAGLGLLGVGPSGDIAPCHRFVDSDAHALGNVSTGINREKQADFLRRGHIKSKYDCHTCWARPLCAGGCHHEAFVRYGDTGHPNLHYCDWIRDWTNTCLEIYGAIAAKNPAFLQQFAERKTQ